LAPLGFGGREGATAAGWWWIQFDFLWQPSIRFFFLNQWCIFIHFFFFHFLSWKEFHNNAEKVWPGPVRRYYCDITLLHSLRKSAGQCIWQIK
jgi:hypothetical protein